MSLLNRVLWPYICELETEYRFAANEKLGPIAPYAVEGVGTDTFSRVAICSKEVFRESHFFHSRHPGRIRRNWRGR